MKKIGIALSLSAVLFVGSCDVLEEVANEVVNGTSTSEGASNALTNEEVIKGLKEALKIGIEKGAESASKMDGFYKNPKIFIPWPEDAVRLKDWANKNGFSGKVDEIETSFNRAAEEASKKATPIFIDAITNMSIADGFEILKGSDSAATMYLQNNTTEALKTEFKPVVHNAVEKVQLTQYWSPVAGAYNKVAQFSNKMEEVNTDLDDYVTMKGIDGLFYLIKEEEKKIRLNPAARVTDILQKVFGSLK